ADGRAADVSGRPAPRRLRSDRERGRPRRPGGGRPGGRKGDLLSSRRWGPARVPVPRARRMGAWPVGNPRAGEWTSTGGRRRSPVLPRARGGVRRARGASRAGGWGVRSGARRASGRGPARAGVRFPGGPVRPRSQLGRPDARRGHRDARARGRRTFRGREGEPTMTTIVLLGVVVGLAVGAGAVWLVYR